MSIRKLGTATGEVTGIDPGTLSRQAVRADTWTDQDGQDLDEENSAADGPADGDD